MTSWVRRWGGQVRRRIRPPSPEQVAARRRGIAIDRDTWDEQFASGQWDFLHDLDESAHHAVLVGWLDLLCPGGSVLDVGCGNGVLMDRLGGRHPYTGVDLSPVAIESLRERASADATLIAADAAQFETDERFDAVVFNESLFMFDRPHREAERYQRFLRPGGVVLVSAFQKPGPAAIMRELESWSTVVVEADVHQAGKHWRCIAIRPGPPASTATPTP